MAQTICWHCNAQYLSERELRDHLGVVHRQFGSEQVGSESDQSEATSFETQGREDLDNSTKE